MIIYWVPTEEDFGKYTLLRGAASEEVAEGEDRR